MCEDVASNINFHLWKILNIRCHTLGKFFSNEQTFQFHKFTVFNPQYDSLVCCVPCTRDCIGHCVLMCLVALEKRKRRYPLLILQFNDPSQRSHL